MSLPEEWRAIPGHDGYEVSNVGRVRSLDRIITRRDGRRASLKGRLLNPGSTKLGYRYAVLGRNATRQVHQLVLEAFVGPRPSSEHVTRHLDGNPANNVVTNLCWGTQSENVLDEVRHGTHNNASKTRCGNGHEYTPENTYVIEGGRQCRECGRERGREYARAKQAAERAAIGRVLHESASRHSASGVRGVHWEPGRGKWAVHCGFKRKHYYLGRYDDMAEAEAVAIVARSRMFSVPDGPRVADARSRLTPEGIRHLSRHGLI